MIEKKSGIYCITNLENNKKYIGQSKNIKQRRYDHLSELRRNSHQNNHLQNAWNIYGEENFSFDVLKYCPIESLDKNEIYYIKHYNTTDREFGYNIEFGGSPVKQLSDETIEKMSHNLSKSQTTTGFFRVSKHYGKTYSQGYRWTYTYTENRNQNTIERINLLDLKKEVELRNLPWKIVNEDLSSKSLEENEENMEKFKNIPKTITYTRVPKSGIRRVSKTQSGSWNYKKKDIAIYSAYLDDLKEKVINNNLPWEIVDEKLAGISFRDSRIKKENNIPGTTGYFRVFKRKTKYAEQGYQYEYEFREFNQRIVLRSIDLEKLEKKVKENGFVWKIINEELASKTFQENKETKAKYPFKLNPYKKTNYYNVFENTTKGIYLYPYTENNKQKELTSQYLAILENKVKEKGFKWKIIDNTKPYLTEQEKQKQFKEYNEKIYRKKSNDSGFYRVTKNKCDTCAKGFRWIYDYSINGVKKSLSSINLKDLEEKVKSKELEWIIVDEIQAKKSMKEDNIKIKNNKQNTGIFRVTKRKCKSCKKGFRWRYRYKENDKNKEFSSETLSELKEKVLQNNLEWKIINEDNAKKSMELDKN